MATVDSKSGKVKIHLGGVDLKKEQYIPNPKSQDGIPDLCGLTNLGEGNVLHNLECRYKMADPKQRCYTSMTAKVLVALNPYERMDVNYTEDVMRAYQSRPMNLEGLVGMDDLPPHVYTVANSAYLNMVARRVNQSIIVCGESGSGKTESAKYMMRYLAFTTTSTSVDPSEFKEADAIGQQVLDANPILESFGNAKTNINNNSSRFGKFTKMLFTDPKGAAAGAKPRKKLVGACIETYLLEKSRVVYQDKGERNYHIFYQLTHCHNQRPELKLAPPEQFNYLNKSGCTELDDLRYPGKGADIEWYKELMHAFKTLLVSDDQVQSVFMKVAGVLHLGNIKFTQRAGEGSDIANPDVMAVATEMFDVDAKGLQARLETRTMYLPGDKTVIKPLNVEDAEFNRDSMCRNLYNGMFRWIVYRINQQSSKDSEAAGTSWIGILDVFGFEIFENNSFEQFCINFANERLQQYFNSHVLQAEQDLYKREALLWDPIDLPNNQDCIDLVMGKPNGILAVLDSTCVQPKGDDAVFVQNLFNAHKYHPRMRKAKSRKISGSKQMESINGFSIRHYAGEVTYNCANFLTKNSDASEWDTLVLFASSRNDVTSKILRMRADGGMDDGDLKRNQKRAFLSTGSVFSDQLSMLMTELKKTAPYFVRCIKPNPEKKPKNFIPDFVRPQLRCGGLIEALRIIKLGFPTRCSYKRIHELFGGILKDKPVVNLNLRDFTEGIMQVCGNQEQKLTMHDYQLGLTMVFFRPGKQEYLTDILDQNPDDISKDKVRAIRKWLIKKRWIRAKGSIKAWLRSGKLMQEMRFKKAALSMVIVYRTFGRALGQVRSSLGGKKEEEEALRRARDLEFQKALIAKQELAKLQELKKQQDAELARLQEEHKKTVQAKDEEIEGQAAKAAEASGKAKELANILAESESKRLATLNENKAKIADLESKLKAENSAVEELRRQQADLQDKKEGLEATLEKSRTANDDLRRAMGLGSQEYEKQIAEKERLVGELRDRTRNLEDQLRSTKEQLDANVRDLSTQLEQARSDARTEQDRLEAMVRDRDTQISRLQSEFTMLKTSTDQRIKDQENALEEARTDLQREKEKLSRQISERDRELNEAKSELTDAHRKLEASGTALADLEHKSKEKQDEHVQSVNEMKEKYDREIKKLEAKLAEQKAEIIIANEKVEAAKRELAASAGSSTEKIAQLERLLKDKEAEVAELQDDLKRTQAKLEELQRTLTEKIGTLQDALSTERSKSRDLATQFEKDSWERNNEIQQVKAELNSVRERLRLEKDASDAASKTSQDQLAQERELAHQRVAKLSSDLQAKSDDLRELKVLYRDDKKEWRAKVEKYERTIHDLEQQIDQLNDQYQAGSQKQADLDKFGQAAVADADARAAKLESKFQTQIEEVRGELKEMEADIEKQRAERARATQDRDLEREAFKERETQYKEDLVKARADIDRVEREYINYKQQASDEVEQKISALQGQVALLQGLADDLKADKIETKDREQALQDQLKEAVAQAAETRSALRMLQSGHGAELEKLRLLLEATREKAVADAKRAREIDEDLKKKIAERESKLSGAKRQLVETLDRENKAKAALRDQQDEVKEKLVELETRNQELEQERRKYQKSTMEYEVKIADVQAKLGESRIALSESHHRRKMGDSDKVALEALKAKVAAAERAVQDQAKAFDRRMKIISEDAKVEKDGLEAEFKRQLKQKEAQTKAQGEAAKFKTQFLGISQEELKAERKRWQDKEREFERAIVALSGEIRELRAEHQQAVDLHEAFRAHVEAKEAARSAEASGWDIKKKSLGGEHSLSLHQLESEKNARISQLERELLKVKDELNDALEEIESLTAGLEKQAPRQSYTPAPAKETKREMKSAPRSPPVQPEPARPEPVEPIAPREPQPETPVATPQPAADDSAPPPQTPQSPEIEEF
jgi:myosin protein heavy chain